MLYRFLFAFLFLTVQYAGATLTWVGGTGFWNTTDSNWNPGPVPWIQTDDALFSVGPSGTVTLNGVDIDFSTITFDVGGYLINSTGAPKFIPSGFATITSALGVSNTISAPFTGANSLVVLGQGTLTLSNGSNSFTGTEVDGGATLINTGTITNPSGDINVGFNSSNNTLTMESGGTITTSLANACKVGASAGNSQNAVNITGTGSSLTCGNLLAIGFEGDHNSLSITNGGQLTCNNGSQTSQAYIGLFNTANFNSVVVSDPSSNLTHHGTFSLGFNGSNNALSIVNGGAVTVTSTNAGQGDFVVGFGPAPNGNSDNNLLTVFGSGSLLTIGTSTNQRTLYIGGESSQLGSGSFNSMQVSQGGQVIVTKNGRIGDNTGYNQNSAVVSDAGSLWSMTGTLRVGSFGSGNFLIVDNGGKVTAGGSCTFGFNTGADGNFGIISDPNSFLVANQVIIGNFGANNSVTVTNNGNLHALSTIFSPITSSPILIASNLNSSGTLNIGNGGLPGNIISAGIVGGFGTASVVFNHTANPYVFSVPMFGFLTLDHIGPGTTILTGANTFTGATVVSQGTLQAGAVDVFSPNSTISIQPNGTLNLGGFNQATLDVTNGGTLRFGTPGVQLTVTGDYTQQSTGNLIETLNFAGGSDLITTTGPITLDGTLAATTVDTFALFHKYHILHSNTSVSGVFSNVTVTNSLVKPFVDYQTFDVYLFFNPNLISAALTHNQREVATQWDNITNPTSDQLTVLNILINLSPDAARNALDDMAGEQHTHFVNLDRFSNEAFNRRVFNAVRNVLLPCWCYDPCKPWQAWAQVEEGQYFTNGDRNSKGFHSLNFAGSLGAFTTLQNFIVGIAANYEYDTVHFNQKGCAHWNTAQGALYGILQGNPGYILADLIAGGSWGTFNRPIAFGTLRRTAKSSPSTIQGLTYVELGGNLCVANVVLQPFAAIEYGVYNQSSYTEKGADSLDLGILNRTTHMIDSYVGGHLTLAWDCAAFSADLAWQHRYKGIDTVTTTQFVDFGTPFPIDGTKLGHDGIKGALNLLSAINEHTDFYVELSGEHWDRITIYAVDVGIHLRF